MPAETISARWPSKMASVRSEVVTNMMSLLVLQSEVEKVEKILSRQLVNQRLRKESDQAKNAFGHEKDDGGKPGLGH